MVSVIDRHNWSYDRSPQWSPQVNIVLMINPGFGWIFRWLKTCVEETFWKGISDRLGRDFFAWLHWPGCYQEWRPESHPLSGWNPSYNCEIVCWCSGSCFCSNGRQHPASPCLSCNWVPAERARDRMEWPAFSLDVNFSIEFHSTRFRQWTLISWKLLSERSGPTFQNGTSFASSEACKDVIKQSILSDASMHLSANHNFTLFSWMTYWKHLFRHTARPKWNLTLNMISQNNFHSYFKAICNIDDECFIWL